MTVLRRRGLHADAARNGVEALEKMGSHRYEVMLLDLMMPHMNGYEVLESPREIWHSEPGEEAKMEVAWLFKEART